MRGASPTQETIVDSSPILQSPPSSTIFTSSPNSSRTCSARVGLTLTVAIGRRRGDAAAERIEQLLSDRVIRDADRDRVLTARDDVVDGGRAFRDERQRAGPERVRQLASPPATSRAPSAAGSEDDRCARLADASRAGPSRGKSYARRRDYSRSRQARRPFQSETRPARPARSASTASWISCCRTRPITMAE